MNTCTSPACIFDKTPNSGIIGFEIFVIIAAILSIVLLSRIEKRIALKFFIVSAGVLIFEFFTHPLWNNYKMGSWAYLYKDISWILTIGWAALILVPVVLVDKYFKKITEGKRFIIQLIAILVLGLLAEALVVNLGIRSYSPEVQEVISGRYIPVLNIPLASLYYIPVFMALVVSFYKFWVFYFNNKLIPPLRNVKWIRTLIFSIIGVLLFEIMIEPLVINAGFPRWLYIYRDVNLVLTGGWIIIIWLSIIGVNKLLIHFDTGKKIFLYVLLSTIIAVPIESVLIKSGNRLYGQSFVENASGFYIPATNIPIEVVFALPFYLLLIIPFILYWAYYHNINKRDEKN